MFDRNDADGVRDLPNRSTVTDDGGHARAENDCTNGHTSLERVPV